ncbi:hypothetical protein [Candidatus Poriferisodalis sp.]
MRADAQNLPLMPSSVTAPITSMVSDACRRAELAVDAVVGDRADHVDGV